MSNQNHPDSQQVLESTVNDSEAAPVNLVNNKRKPTRTPSIAWDDFEKDEVLRTATCNHCKIVYKAKGKKHGTSTLLNRLKVYPKNPKKINDKKQKKLGSFYKKYEDRVDAKGKPELGIVEFNQDECRIALAKMIIKDELSFKFVENEGFRKFMLATQPQFNIPSRITIARDCMKLYHDEKLRLKTVFSTKSLRVCLTTDTWTSIQNLNYMCVTSHFINDEWNYQKKILSFCLVPNHKGETIGRFLEKCLLEWGIERVSTVTLDNVSSNNLAISYLSKKVNNWNGDLLKGELMHMRCCAHIINLIVKDGLKEQDDSIERIRIAIKYVKSSPARELKFDSCIEKEKIHSKGSVNLDVSTRWNSIYLMLETAQKFEKVFDRLAEEDEHYAYALENEKEKGKGKPTSDDWDNARHLCKFLKVFYHATLRFSGSSYVTSNGFFHQFCEILETLKAWSTSCDIRLSLMASTMQAKFDKYWDDEQNLNYCIFVAVVLDPRYKLGCVEFCFDRLYTLDKAKKKIDKVKDILNRLYTTYSILHPDLGNPSSFNDQALPEVTDFGLTLSSQYKRKLKEKDSVDKKNELDRYLSEDAEEDYGGFDILDWWRHKTSKFPVLTHIARDILAIPVSSVASECVFSTGGRILDTFRSSLDPKTVEAIICAQNWFKTSKIDLPKQFGEIESIELDSDTIPKDVEK